MFYSRDSLKQGLKRITRNLPARKMESAFQSEETVCAGEQGMRGPECPGISGKLSTVHVEDVRTDRWERSLGRKGSGGRGVLGNWLSNK